MLSSLSHKHIITFHGAVISAPNYCLVTGEYGVGRGVRGCGGGWGWGDGGEVHKDHYIPQCCNQCAKLLPCHW